MTEPMGHAIDTKGLRERNIPQHAPTTEGAKKVVEDLNAEEEDTLEAAKNKKTFGRTPNGTGKYLCYINLDFYDASSQSHLTNRCTCPVPEIVVLPFRDSFMANNIYV
jgi:hypothetical protein